MYSDRETSTNKSEVFEPNDIEQLEVFSKCHLSRKALWDLSRKKETYRKVLLYSPDNYKPGNTGAIQKRRKVETRVIADNNAGKIIETEMEQDQLDSIRGQKSNIQVEMLKETYRKVLLYSPVNYKPGNTGALPKRRKVETGVIADNNAGKIIETEMEQDQLDSISGKKSNIKVEMLKMTFNQKAENKDQINSHVKNSDIECFEKFPLQNIKNDINCPYNIVKVDIFNKPPLKKVLTVENKTAKITEVLQQQPEIIRNSDEDRKMEVETNKTDSIQPDIIKVAHHFPEFAQNTSEFAIDCSKSTQKPESLLDTRTQTSECSETKQLASKSKFPTTSSFKKRQLELHRLRVQVEQKRLELLELKISRERQEIEHEQILFEKRLQIKTLNFNQVNEDTDV